MGDGKSSRVRSSSGFAPRLTSKRSSRFISRRSIRSFNIERAPMVLEFDSTVVRAGYADQFKPQHVIPFFDTLLGPPSSAATTRTTTTTTTTETPPAAEAPAEEGAEAPPAEAPAEAPPAEAPPAEAPPAEAPPAEGSGEGTNDDDNNNDNDNPGNVIINISNKTESQWYGILSPLVHRIYDRLMCKPSTRRVVVVHKKHIFVPSAWKAALKQILWNKGVPAIVFWSSLEVFPVAQGWKRGLIVEVNRDEAVCICHCDGHALPFTFQSVPCGYKALLDDERVLQTAWTTKMDRTLLDEKNPDSLVVAVLKCLESCPRDLRLSVVSNIVFSGEGLLLLPDLARRVGKRVKNILEGTHTDLGEVGEGQVPNTVLSAIPVQVAKLRPLTERLSITSCAPHRPDFISWVASALWTSAWSRFDDGESAIGWSVAPSEG